MGVIFAPIAELHKCSNPGKKASLVTLHASSKIPNTGQLEPRRCDNWRFSADCHAAFNMKPFADESHTWHGVARSGYARVYACLSATRVTRVPASSEYDSQAVPLSRWRRAKTRLSSRGSSKAASSRRA